MHDLQDRHCKAIAEYYGDRAAKRSNVPLFHHIIEGLVVLDAIGATLSACQAYCIHPMLQSDEALTESLLSGSEFDRCSADPRAVVLAMEYRRVANAYLSDHCKSDRDSFEVSTLHEVNQMLIADKVQNRKDFEIYHAASHPRSATLALYFGNWLTRLGVSEEQYQSLRTQLEAG